VEHLNSMRWSSKGRVSRLDTSTLDVHRDDGTGAKSQEPKHHDDNEVSKAQRGICMGGAMKQDAIAFIGGKEMGNGLFDFRVRQICCDVFSEIALEGQVMKELPQGPDRSAPFSHGSGGPVISDEVGKVSVCDGLDSRKAIGFKELTEFNDSY
jgi:hypothetical protein